MKTTKIVVQKHTILVVLIKRRRMANASERAATQVRACCDALAAFCPHATHIHTLIR